MKKLLALLLVLVLMVSFAACGNQKLTMRKLIDANQTQTLLESYESISTQFTIDGEMNVAYYLTDTFAYEKQGTWSMYVTDDAGYGCSDGVYQKVVFLTRDGLIDYAACRAEQYADPILGQKSLLEKIQSVEEAEDQITVKTVMSLKNLKKILGEESLNSYENTYVLDPETYALHSANGVITLNDGTSYPFSLVCSYNAEMPEEIKDFLEYENQTENLRTITFVFHSGTAKEKTEQIQAPKGLALGLHLPDSASASDSFGVYADPACTEPFKSNGDYTSDVTVYIH